jgi:DNA polymerase-3 subunit gamma/tau
MTHTIIARKYRPERFEEVIGQDHVVRTLRNAIASGRVANAYLLTGPRGVGKTSIARILAKCLNCHEGPSGHPCGKCSECLAISGGASNDVREIDGASNNGIEQVRGIRESIRLTPCHGNFRIYIVDEVHMLSQSAFNSLQKTVEEPPAHARFIFATTESDRLPASFKSRCQRLDLRPLAEGAIADHLSNIAGREGVALDQAGALAIARGARGGMRDAESMLDQAIAACGDAITESGVEGIFGMVSLEEVCGLVVDVIEGDLSSALSKAEDIGERGMDIVGLGEELRQVLLELLLAEAGGGGGGGGGVRWREPLVSRVRGKVPVGRLGDFVGTMGAGLAAMSHSNDKKASLEMTLIKGYQSLHTASTDEVLETLKTLSHR